MTTIPNLNDATKLYRENVGVVLREVLLADDVVAEQAVGLNGLTALLAASYEHGQLKRGDDNTALAKHLRAKLQIILDNLKVCYVETPANTQVPEDEDEDEGIFETTPPQMRKYPIRLIRNLSAISIDDEYTRPRPIGWNGAMVPHKRYCAQAVLDKLWESDDWKSLVIGIHPTDYSQCTMVHLEEFVKFYELVAIQTERSIIVGVVTKRLTASVTDETIMFRPMWVTTGGLLRLSKPGIISYPGEEHGTRIISVIGSK